MADSNCPNCGAPKTGPSCQYCGTLLENPEKTISLAIGKTVSVSFEHDGRLYEFDMQLDNVRVDSFVDSVDVFSDGGLFKTMYGDPRFETSLNGRLVPSVKHGSKGMWFYRELAPEEVTC